MTNDEEGYILTYQQGQQVAEILRRYIGEELKPEVESLQSNGVMAQEDIAWSSGKLKADIDYIEGLEKLFPTREATLLAGHHRLAAFKQAGVSLADIPAQLIPFDALNAKADKLPDGMTAVTTTTLHVTVPDEIDTEDFEETIEPFCYQEGGQLRHGIEIGKDGIENALEYLEGDREDKPELCDFLKLVLEHAGKLDDFFFSKRRDTK